jgi:hypothetical protein
MKKKFIYPLLFACLTACSDFSSQADKAPDGIFRIPIGDCATAQSPNATWTYVYNLMSTPAGAGSKGCAGANSCHSTATNLGGWNMGTSKPQARTNLLTLSGLSGKRLITPGSLDNSNVLIRLSQILNPMPRDGDLWFNTDLDALKTWICQGALDN